MGIFVSSKQRFCNPRQKRTRWIKPFVSPLEKTVQNSFARCVQVAVSFHFIPSLVGSSVAVRKFRSRVTRTPDWLQKISDMLSEYEM